MLQDGKFENWPMVSTKATLSLPVGKLPEYIPFPAPTFDLDKYASDAGEPNMESYIIGSSKKTNTHKFPSGPEMTGVQAALCLRKYGGFSGRDLINMVGIWNRETIGGSDCGVYPHQVVWRPSTGDYSFGGGGFNMIRKLGPSRRASLSKLLGHDIHNRDLLDPIIMAAACRWLFDAGVKSHGDGLQHWGGYKRPGGGLDGVNIAAATNAVTLSMTSAPVVVTFSELAEYFQNAMVYLDIRDYEDKPLLVDGKYGKRSVSTCMKFQINYGVSSDAAGVVGPKTWKEIDLAVLRKIYYNN